MKEFYVELYGFWGDSFNIEANSKEEAIEEAMDKIDQGSPSVYLDHIEQYAEELKGGYICWPRPEDMPISEEIYQKYIFPENKKDAQKNRIATRAKIITLKPRNAKSQ